MTDLVLLPPGALRSHCPNPDCNFVFIVTATSYRGDPIWFLCTCGQTTFVYAPVEAA